MLITVPAEMAGTEVIWTLKHAGYEYSIPGRATSTTYELSDDGAALAHSSLRFGLKWMGWNQPTMKELLLERLSTSVGKPLTLSAFAQDRSNRDAYPENNEFFHYQIGAEWIFHQGPAAPDFSQAFITGEERVKQSGTEVGPEDWTKVQTEVTFWEPGDYLIRLRVDNFLAPDSRFDYMCCWSNAFVQ